MPALGGWKSDGLANLSETTLYNDIKRLADRCRAVFGCLDMEYDVDDIVLDYVIYRYGLHAAISCHFGLYILWLFSGCSSLVPSSSEETERRALPTKIQRSKPRQTGSVRLDTTLSSDLNRRRRSRQRRPAEEVPRMATREATSPSRTCLRP